MRSGTQNLSVHRFLGVTGMVGSSRSNPVVDLGNLERPKTAGSVGRQAPSIYPENKLNP
jgi:hypothetical protein